MEEFRMTRIQISLAFLMCVFVPLGVMAAPPAQPTKPAKPLTTEVRAAPVSTDLVAAVDGKPEAGYAEVEAIDECCQDAAMCCPKWTVGGGVMFLSRTSPRANPPATVYQRQTGGLQPVFDMTYSSLGTAVGPDITLGRCLGPCWDVEARYFQLDNWSNASLVGSPNLLVGTAYSAAAVGNFIAMDYSSRLYNIEFNLRWKRCEQIPVLAGFRMLGLDERFQMANALTGGIWNVPAETTTNNALYGAQIGAEPVLWDYCGWFRLESIVKAGIYANCAHQRTVFLGAGGVGLDSRSSGVPAFVGEVGLTGVCRLNKCWSLRAGYEAMWLTDLALAPDQAASVQFGSPVTGEMYNKATIFYYGFTASVERRF
jgi:hypothetical protein